MSYEIHYLDVLKGLLSPLDPLMALIMFVVFIVGPGATVWVLKRSGKWSRYWWQVPVGPLILITILLFGIWPQEGAGWRLTDGKLKIRAWPVSTTLDTKKIRAALVESSSPWRPVMRTNGYGTPGLCTGWCRLANGKKAVVFRHLRPPEMVLIEAGSRYYIISHPGIEKLYDALIAQGAVQWTADTGEGKGDV
ncbi:MAG: PH domain-containing protein [Bacillota bacterium]